MSGGAYRVSVSALRETAAGITDTLHALDGLGMAGMADAGRGFTGLALPGLRVGHAGLRQAFATWLDRWSWGVRSLVHDGNQVAGQLHLAAGSYQDVEGYVAGVFKDVYADVLGNPHTGDQQVEASSWGQVLADNPITAVTHPDMSAGSCRQTGQHMTTTWSGVGRDLANGPLDITGHVADALGHGNQLRAAENEVFGPPPTGSGGA